MIKLFESWKDNLYKYTCLFEENGYIVVKHAIHQDFIDYAANKIQKCIDGGDISRSKRRLKHEYIFEFPDQQETLVEFVETIGKLTGLPYQDLIISERHLKIYRDDAAQNPAPHKDRRGTQLSIGIPLEVAPESRLILYPHHDRRENSFDSYDDFLASLSEEERPENALKGVEPVIIDTRPGDLIVFFGSSIWHERLNAAGSKILYFKMNTFNSDPLNENISALPLSAQTAAQEMEAEPA